MTTSPGHFAHGLAERLTTTRIGRRVFAFDELDSTNTYALDHGEDGAVYVAERQTAGRGRFNRQWLSKGGVGLWFTVALENAPEGLVYTAALAVRDGAAPDCALAIKWPNDLLYNKRKVCGILVEQREHLTALGIGINVRQQPGDFPPELREKASSLEHESGRTIDRAALLQRVLTDLDQKIMLLEQGSAAALRSEWAAACNLAGRRVQCGDTRGTVLDIDEAGALHLETTEGRVRLLSGDLTFLDGA